MIKPTIDLDLEQVNAEIRELRQRLFLYLTMRERQRYEATLQHYEALLRRMHQLLHVIEQRKKEHEEGER